MKPRVFFRGGMWVASFPVPNFYAQRYEFAYYSLPEAIQRVCQYYRSGQRVKK